MQTIAREFLVDAASGSAIKALAMTKATGTYYSTAQPMRHLRDCSILLISTAGSLDVTYEVSDDGMTWYEPYSAAGDKINTIVEDLPDGSRWIVFEAVAAEYIRFKFVLTEANSTVTAKFRFTE